MNGSLPGDRIVLGIQSEDARKRLLQEGKLDLKRCIDICRTSESATTHLQALGEVVHRVDGRANDLSKKNRKRGERTETLFEGKSTELRKLKCKFCSQSHSVLRTELCPALGKRWNVCRKMNHRKGSEVCAMKGKISSVNQGRFPFRKKTRKSWWEQKWNFRLVKSCSIWS